MITILKFYANWCKPCAILSGRLEEYEDMITSIDIEKNIELSQEYHVRHVPTLIFLKDDVVVHRVTGLMSAKEFGNILDEINDDKTIDPYISELKADLSLDNLKEE